MMQIYPENEYDEIVHNLFIGSQPRFIDEFSYVIACNGAPTYYVPLGKLVIVRPFDDCGVIPDEEMLYWLASLAVEFASKGKTLVHCTAGINRSSLVVALALMQVGFTAVDAIKLIHEKRSNMCLSNNVFKGWLLKQ